MCGSCVLCCRKAPFYDEVGLWAALDASEAAALGNRSGCVKLSIAINRKTQGSQLARTWFQLAHVRSRITTSGQTRIATAWRNPFRDGQHVWRATWCLFRRREHKPATVHRHSQQCQGDAPQPVVTAEISHESPFYTDRDQPSVIRPAPSPNQNAAQHPNTSNPPVQAHLHNLSCPPWLASGSHRSSNLSADSIAVGAVGSRVHAQEPPR